MADFDADMFAEQIALVGLLSREELRWARSEAEDGSLDSLSKVLLRKGLLTSWQRDRILKGDAGGFFFGGCKILFHIAEGTFARVYRGVRPNTNEAVAIKVMRRRFTIDTDAVARFRQEAESGMKLVHPNIVRIVDFGEQDKLHYMIMEYVEGSNLRDFLKIRHRLSASEALPIMVGLARGLKFSLDNGVTHRDIKGTNILIGTRGEAKLVDFGLATIEGDENKMAIAHGQRTVDYSALERSCGSPKGDHRSDIYFLGCVFYQMLTGVLPLPEVETSDPLAKMLKRSFGAIKPLNEHRHAPPKEICRIIEKMMKIDPDARYQDMDDCVDELEAYQAEVAQTTPTGGPSPAGGPKSDPSLKKPEFEDMEDLFRQAYTAAPSPEYNPAAPASKPAAAVSASKPAADAAPKVTVSKSAANANGPAAAAPVVVHHGPRFLLCVEAQDSIQDAFRKVLSQMGYRVMLVRDAERAAERYREMPPDAVIFDADGLGPEAFDAFIDMHNKAHEDGHDLAALVILSPRQINLARRLPPDDRLVILAKPLKMKEVQDALNQLVPIAQGSGMAAEGGD